ncbi:MAG: penicillin-binding protein 2 [Actinomycetales bacterium]|nr:penicillin-binding protein 2 [Actinomycetales bacterium]
MSRRPGRPEVRVPRPQTSPAVARRHRSLRPLWGLLAVALLLGSVLAGRLLDLQVVNHQELAVQAAEVSTRVVTEPALRGRVLAADGTALVANAPTTVVTIDPRTLLESDDEGRALIEQVAAELDLPVESLWGRTRLCGTQGAPPVPSCFSGSPYQPIPVAFDVDPVAALSVLERPERFPGVAIDTRPVRTYPQATLNAAHLLGYLGRPTLEEVTTREGLTAEDLVGRAGLEATYDSVLRGTSGRTTVTIDPRGVVTGQLEHSDPVSGLDLVTHLDAELQAEVERVLAGTVRISRAQGWPAESAAAVVLDVTDGGVVAAASYPTYDPSIWTTGVTQTQYDDLTSDASGQPLVNRVVSETFPPASTFKVVSLPAALATGVDPDQEYACPGAVDIGGRRFTNYESRAHGPLSLQRIMEVSCDTVFYGWAYDEWRAQGGLAQESDLTDPWVITSEQFGLGQRTGVDLPGEAAGVVPGREWKRAYWEATREDSCARAESGYPEETDRARREFLEQLARENCEDGWQYRPGDAVNFSIGQGDVAVTPLQQAVVYAAIANGGTLWEPQVVDAVRTPAGELVEDLPPVASGELGLEPEVLEIVRSGLAGVNTAGTGAPAFAGFDLAAYPVAGKTGSAESFGERSTAWYASYGPTTDPRYAVVVVVEQGGIGGDIAAPAARRIWDAIARG